MIKTLIVEDEPGNIKIFRNMTEGYCPQVDICGEAGDVQTAFELIKRIPPQLVFLDIEIPGGNAFTLLDQLKPINFEIIFVTAYDSYTLKAIKYSALDYLLKPVSIEELISAVNKVAKKINKQQLQQRIEHLMLNMQPAKKNLQSIAVPAHFGYEFIIISNIIRCEANGNYTYFFMNYGRKVISVKNLKEYEDMLSPDVFFRIHHSHIININFIKRYHKSNVIIEMEDGAMIPIATRRKKEFLNLFMGE
ncbi:LytTR family DNA-binding domain-containing protein [soil metagenome]